MVGDVAAPKVIQAVGRNNLKGASMAQASLPALASLEGGLSRYLDEIRKFPMLAPEEEYMLAKRYREHADPRAAERLVTSHLRLVAKIAMGYRGYGLPVAEVISEGNVGLMQAVKRFESPRRASVWPPPWWIKASIQEVHPALVEPREDGDDREPSGSSSTCVA